MTETKTKAEERTKLTLQQKFVKLREAIPVITKKQHSDGVKYKFARITDIYELLSPAMNEWGVNFDIIGEKATRHDANGDDLYYHSYIQHTRNGDRVVWVYEADITLRWVNADDPNDYQDVTLHAIGTNDGSPDKAKGSSWTYCLKYYFFEKFNVDQSENDPDMTDYGSDAPPQNRGTAPQNNAGRGNNQPAAEKAGNQSTGAPKLLSDAQLSRMYRKGEDAGHNQATINGWIAKKYGQQDPHNLTRAQYDEICKSLDEQAKQKGGNK